MLFQVKLKGHIHILIHSNIWTLFIIQLFQNTMIHVFNVCGLCTLEHLQWMDV